MSEMAGGELKSMSRGPNGRLFPLWKYGHGRWKDEDKIEAKGQIRNELRQVFIDLILGKKR